MAEAVFTCIAYRLLCGEALFEELVLGCPLEGARDNARVNVCCASDGIHVGGSIGRLRTIHTGFRLHFPLDLAGVLLHFRLAARFLRQSIWAVATVAHVFVANFAQLEFGVKHPVSVYFVSELDQVRRF